MSHQHINIDSELFQSIDSFGHARAIQSKGIEFLRNVYATAGLSIAPKQKGWELEATAGRKK
jgi:hypothetical protein